MQTIEAVAEQAAKADMDVVTGIGVALFLAGGAGFWALIHLRGKTVDRLWSHIDIAFEALTDKAFASLGTLRTHINELLPDPDTEFDPLDVIVDPSSVEKPAKVSIRLLKERHRIRRQYRRLLRVCSLLKYSVLAFTVAVAITTLCYQFAFSDSGLWQFFFYVTAGIALGALALLAAYTTLVARIDGVIENCKPQSARAVVSAR
jgi:hypothetical protein